MCFPKRYWHPIPQYLYMWSYFEMRSLQIIKLRWVYQGGPYSNMTAVLINRGNLDTERYRGKKMWRHTAKIIYRWCLMLPQWGEMERMLPHSPKKEMTSSHTLVPDYQPQNHETIHFWCLDHLLYDTLLWQPQETNKHIKMHTYICYKNLRGIIF